MIKPTRMNENRQNSLSATTSASRLTSGGQSNVFVVSGLSPCCSLPWTRGVACGPPADAHHSAARTQTRSSAFRSQATQNFQA